MKGRIVIFALLFSLGVRAQLTIEECQDKARQNYPLIQQFDLIDQSREYTISNANKAYLPQLSVTAIGGIVDGFPEIGIPGSSSSGSNNMQFISILQFNQTIWDGGITKSRKRISEANADIEMADVEVNLHSIKERVNGLFFGILLIDEQIEQTKFLNSNLEKNYKRLTSLYENGAVLKSDVDEIQVELIASEQRLSELRFNRGAYLNMLSIFIGESPDEDMALQKPALEENFSAGEIKRPELELFASQTRMIESKSRLDKSKIFPKVGLMGFGTFIQPGIAFGANDLNRIIVAGLSLSWELGSLYSRSNDQKLGEVGLAKIANRKETFLFSTNLQLTQVEKEIEKFNSLLGQDREIVLLKNNIKRSYQSKFDNGVCTTTELLHKINDENMAKQNLILHEIQYMMAVYQYKTISGN